MFYKNQFCLVLFSVSLVTPGSVQNLFLYLHSGILLVVFGEPYDAGNQTHVVYMLSKY